MNYKSFVFALFFLLASTSCVYAQNEGKQVGKAVEAAVSKKVPAGVPAKAAKMPKVTPVPAVKAPVAPRVPAAKAATAAPRANAAAKLPPPVSATKLMQGMKSSSPKTGTLTVSVAVITRDNTVQFLTEQARLERHKVRQESEAAGYGVVDDTGLYLDGKPIDPSELPHATKADREEYAQAVRDMLLSKREQMMKEKGKEFLQEKFGGKTYNWTVKLAEDIAMDNLRGLEAPPCFYSTPYGSFDRGVGYVLEIPAQGMSIVHSDGTKQVLDPDTQVIFYQPDPGGIGGLDAKIIERIALENPQNYHWRSPRPDKKFAAEHKIGPGFGKGSDDGGMI